MVVVVILGLLATLVTINAPAIIHNQRVKAAKQNIARLSNAVEMYYVEMGKYPQTLNDLTLKTDKSGIKFIKKVPKDPWGNEFVYRVPGLHGEDFSISSLGADGQEGGDGRNADINSWDLEEEEESQ
jgi:general secretion pathway protein G